MPKPIRAFLVDNASDTVVTLHVNDVPVAAEFPSIRAAQRVLRSIPADDRTNVSVYAECDLRS